ncbi:MAG: MBL fold metallo-hydrolase [Clostridia bacterium]|nr:MBL fold metallo-hydrolase [Clostridia bacterium]
MTVTWLGQAGLLFESEGRRIIIDPYLSDSVGKVNPANKRRVPVDPRFFDVEPDVLIFTHDHLDHFDPESAEVYLGRSEKKITVLGPNSVWQKARQYQNGHNYVLFGEGVEWTEGNLRFFAVPACHSDPDAIGVVITDLSEGKTYYVTGDTLYRRDIPEALPQKPDVIFLPINGAGNNMNSADASRFAEAVGADVAVPLHFGLFDEIDPAIFIHPGRVIPEFYQIIKL